MKNFLNHFWPWSRIAALKAEVQQLREALLREQISHSITTNRQTENIRRMVTIMAIRTGLMGLCLLFAFGASGQPIARNSYTTNAVGKTPTVLSANDSVALQFLLHQPSSGTIFSSSLFWVSNGIFIGGASGLTNLPLTALQSGGASPGQVQQWNGSAWVPANVSGGGGGSSDIIGTNMSSYLSGTNRVINADVSHSEVSAIGTAGSNNVMVASNNLQSAINTLGTASSNNVMVVSNNLLSSINALGTSVTNGLGNALSNDVMVASNNLQTSINNVGTAGSNNVIVSSNNLQTSINTLGTATSNNVMVASNNLLSSINAMGTSITNGLGSALSNDVMVASNNLNGSINAMGTSITNGLGVALSNDVTVASNNLQNSINTLGTATSNNTMVASNNLLSSINAMGTSITNGLGVALSNDVTVASNNLQNSINTLGTATSNNTMVASNNLLSSINAMGTSITNGLGLALSNDVTVASNNLQSTINTLGVATSNNTMVASNNLIGSINAMGTSVTNGLGNALSNDVMIASNNILLAAGSSASIGFSNVNPTQFSVSGGTLSLTNGVPITNAINYGNPFQSPGVGANSMQFGLGAQSPGFSSLAVGYNAYANDQGVGLGLQARALAANAIAIGPNSLAYANSSIAIGLGATVPPTNTGSIALGAGSLATSTNQIMLGATGYNTVVPGSLSVGGLLSLGLGGLVTSNSVVGTDGSGNVISYSAGAGMSISNGVISSTGGASSAVNGGLGIVVSTNSGLYTISLQNPLPVDQLIVSTIITTNAVLNLANSTNLPVTGINASGTPNSTTFLRGDGTWATGGGGGGGDVYQAGSNYFTGVNTFTNTSASATNNGLNIYTRTNQVTNAFAVYNSSNAYPVTISAAGGLNVGYPDTTDAGAGNLLVTNQITAGSVSAGTVSAGVVVATTRFMGNLSQGTNANIWTTADYVMTTNDVTVLVAPAHKVTVPDPKLVYGKWIYIQLTAAGTNAIVPFGAETFNVTGSVGVAKLTNTSAGQITALQSNGTNYWGWVK